MQHTKNTNMRLDHAMELGYVPKEGELCYRMFDKGVTKTPQIIISVTPANEYSCGHILIEDSITKYRRDCSANAVYKKFKVLTELIVAD